MEESKNTDDRSTAELVEVLSNDFHRLEKRMVTSAKRGYMSSADESNARSLIRALFALVEGVVYAMKIDALFVAEERGQPLSFAESALVFELRHELSDHGEVIERPANVTLERNVRFAFRLYAQVFGIASSLDTNSDWWHALRRSMRVRNRLMHPRQPADLDIGPKHVVDAVVAKRGFIQAVGETLRHKESVPKAPRPNQAHAADSLKTRG